MAALVHEKVWFDRTVYNDAERDYYLSLSKVHASPLEATRTSLASEVAKARLHIKKSLECMDSVAALTGVPNTELNYRVSKLETENTNLKKAIGELRNLVIGLHARVESVASSGSAKTVPAKAPAPTTSAAVDDDEDDGVDLFGSDDEEESAEAAKLREERVAAYNAKKAKKPVLIAKSHLILDVKPWDDETDMAAMEQSVRAISTDGLLWGTSKLMPLAYGIHKLQISCVVEDDKVSIEWLIEQLEKIEEYVQSIDVAAFNKV